MDVVVQANQDRHDCEKIHVETEAFWQMYSDLQKRYLGEFVVVYQQQVVDHDRDVLQLEQRVVERFGDTTILLAPVTTIAKRDLQRRGFRLTLGMAIKQIRQNLSGLGDLTGLKSLGLFSCRSLA